MLSQEPARVTESPCYFSHPCLSPTRPPWGNEHPELLCTGKQEKYIDIIILAHCFYPAVYSELSL